MNDAMGSIQGGWEYVWTAYIVTTIVLLGYLVSVFARYRAEKARSEREARRAPEGD